MPVQVTPEYVSQAASSCTNIADEVWNDLGQLQQYITGVEGWWHGIASNTFQDLMVEFHTYATMLYNALTDIGQGLQGNYVNYYDTEQANVATINNMQQALNGMNFS